MIMATVHKFCNRSSLTTVFRNLNPSSSKSCNGQILSYTNYHVHAKCLTTRQFHDFNQLLDASKTDEYLFKDDGYAGYHVLTVDIKDLKSSVSATKRSALFKELVRDKFELTKQETEALYRQYPSLWKRYFYKTFNYLQDFGLSKSTFLRYPWLVSLKPGNNSQYPLQFI